jgi:hypothetical protein
MARKRASPPRTKSPSCQSARLREQGATTLPPIAPPPLFTPTVVMIPPIVPTAMPMPPIASLPFASATTPFPITQTPPAFPTPMAAIPMQQLVPGVHPPNLIPTQTRTVHFNVPEAKSHRRQRQRQ